VRAEALSSDKGNEVRNTVSCPLTRFLVMSGI